MEEVKEIRVSDVISLLKNGYMRWTKDEFEPGKSIQSHYRLSFSECKTLFAVPAIKGVKTKIQTIRVVDDTTLQGVIETAVDRLTLTLQQEDFQNVRNVRYTGRYTGNNTIQESAPTVEETATDYNYRITLDGLPDASIGTHPNISEEMSSVGINVNRLSTVTDSQGTMHWAYLDGRNDGRTATTEQIEAVLSTGTGARDLVEAIVGHPMNPIQEVHVDIPEPVVPEPTIEIVELAPIVREEAPQLSEEQVREQLERQIVDIFS